MRIRTMILAASSAAIVMGCGKKEAAPAAPAPESAVEVNGLKTPAAFASVADDTARAAAIFEEMSKVLLHPRCANCHPKAGGPTQGDDMSPHNPPVVRGDNMGAAGMECSTCHGAENAAFATMTGSVPGASPWALPPVSMGWAGATPAELCAQLKDPTKTGGRTLEDLVEHNGVDHLVGWAWAPGEGRTPAPGDQKTLGALTAAWVEAGAACPG